MARILFCWELGGALGHLATVQTLAARLHALGHEVHLATAARISPDAMHVPASLHTMPAWRPMKTAAVVRTYAHILRNVGYADPAQLSFHLRAWQGMFQRVRPDVLVCETSPTALLAARGMNLPTINIGTGFSIPPRVHPLPDLHHWAPLGAETFVGDEDSLTATINEVLRAEHRAGLHHLHEMFDATLTAVCSVPELDAYSERSLESYVGDLARLPGIQMHWPGSSSKRLFAYLKTFPELPQLLTALRQHDISVLIYAPGLPRAMVDRYRCAHMQFAPRPLDVNYTLRTASLVITHGHGLTLQALQAGVPVLNFPLLLEQHIVARRIAASSLGSFCSPWGSSRIAITLDALLNDRTFARRARVFADRYAHFRSDEQGARLATRIAELAN